MGVELDACLSRDPQGPPGRWGSHASRSANRGPLPLWPTGERRASGRPPNIHIWENSLAGPPPLADSSARRGRAGLGLVERVGELPRGGAPRLDAGVDVRLGTDRLRVRPEQQLGERPVAGHADAG